ncbi:biliverdin-producing heme oxygenase [Candidatus Symbiobacter mobilis]|uniref:Heme oxygenase n=1 Tax=Candidatus Symbiobacter mobilis CR TaxID=946483 RepID=U5NB93_9BURK|nr:biliverdin-producing heme oxygenase [Candidatus Symbiobacter mobilis]AGX88692.1 heme oxygenase [Candidatus Symbiobacter mobilis CR]
MTEETTPPAKTELHRRMRQASKLEHRTIDHHPLLAPMLKASLTKEQYAQALGALHSVHAEAESHIHATLDAHPEWAGFRPRRRLHLLEADLQALGAQPFASPVGFSAPRSIGELVGLLYTVEGSNLGGQVIARTVRDLGHGDLPMQFFDGHGEAARELWEQFLQYANRMCPEEEYDVAAATAYKLFKSIEAHLDKAWAAAGQ